MAIQKNSFDVNYYLHHYEILPNELNRFRQIDYKIIGPDVPNSVDVKGIFVAVGFPAARNSEGMVRVYNLNDKLNQVTQTIGGQGIEGVGNRVKIEKETFGPTSVT